MNSGGIVSLHGRNFLKELDFTRDEWMSLVALSFQLKADNKNGKEPRRLLGKKIALIFEKTSTRTRCAFEVAAYDQGAHVTYLEPTGSQIGHKESIADTARVLGRMFDGIEYRGFGQSVVEELGRQAGVPVWTGLTNEWHPTQSLCDVMTMIEHAGKPVEEISFAYVGDSRYNIGNSLLITGAMLGMDVRIVAPPSLQNWPHIIDQAQGIGIQSGARITVTDDIDEGVAGVDFIYTDVWVSMGEPKDVWLERIPMLMPYRVTRAMLERTGNPNVKFMHCLPAFHDSRTTMGADILRDVTLADGDDGLEVSDEVFESPASIVFDQAENRMHTIKAILVATLAG
ncbi:MAG: ornithine carbamoyltransferase [Propionibacteriaceae bacterium]|jgi:ornithine carbamoyltransferase|nr:ornithine carbamoyltransferase [Propionibacteriaceae bacterium]